MTELLDEVAERLQALDRSLPRRLEAANISIRAKLPFHVVQHREGLAWRCVELSHDGASALRSRRYAAGSLLVRAVVETVAAVWYLQAKVAAAIEGGSTTDLETAVRRSLLGSRMSAEMPEAINVMTFVQAVDKDLEGFREQFDRLCEYAHPNWAGTALLFSQTHFDEAAVEFGRYPQGADHVETLAVVNLSVALGLFEHAYNALADRQNDLVRLCEAQLDAREHQLPAEGC